MTVIDRFGGVAVLCVGDVMLDRFVSGTVHRVSPESPVPVLSIREVRLFPGGAANVARNVAALGGRCTLMGVVGADAIAGELAAAVAQISGVTPLLAVAAGRPTTEKVRFVAQGQQLLRADQEDASALSAEVEQRLLDSIEREIDGHHVVVLSDYAKGVLTPGLVRGAIALARSRHIPVIVDPKSPDMARYAGATIVTPNAKEVHAATGLEPTDDDDVAVRAGNRILADAALESVLITRAHRGMTLVSRAEAPAHLPASAREVFDVVGAGDTVVATLALAIGAGETLTDAAMLANVAAGVVVGKRGTATVSPVELAQELARLGAGHLAPVHGKIMGAASAELQAQAWRREGHAIGLLNGRFDGLKAADVSLLSMARSHCGRLIVGVQSDASAGILSGAGPASASQDDRATLLAALSAVDAVVVFDDATLADLVRRIAPELLVGDAAQPAADPVGADLVRAAGGRVLHAGAVDSDARGSTGRRVAATVRRPAAVNEAAQQSSLPE